jgi:hypothetical protein
MTVRVMHLGTTEDAVIDAVSNDGRTLLVAGEQYTLRALNGKFVHANQPYYGTWLSLRAP